MPCDFTGFFCGSKEEKMSEKILFISDLDGTLLDKNACLPERAAERINRLTDSGVMITYATARTVRSVTHILGDIDFTLSGACPIALMNGVLVRDMAAGKYVRAAVIKKETAEKIPAALDKIDGIEPFVYAIDEEHPMHGDPLYTYYREIVNKPMQDFMDERVVRYGKPFTKIASTASLGEISGDIIYFAILGGERAVCEAAAAMAEVSGIRYTYYRDAYADDVWYLEIFDAAASKKHAVEYLRDITGAEKVVCFGDNINDLPMFEVADIAVAVENGVDEVKAAADYVTDDVIGFIEGYMEE